MAQIADTAISLSSTQYMRNFYVANKDAFATAKRSEFSKNKLSHEDSAALRRAIKNLGTTSYDDINDGNVRNATSAFIKTYNNLLSSAGKSEDSEVKSATNKLKSITGEYADELNEIGITVNSDGTLEERSGLFPTADLSKFKDIFGKESEYMSKAQTYAKRIQTRSNQLVLQDAQTAKKNAAAKKTDTTTENTAAASTNTNTAMSAADLNTLTNNGIGQNVNLIL